VLELIERVKAIMLTPRAEWPAVARESDDTFALRYIAILALIPSLARLVGGWLIGGYTPLFPALVGAVVGYALNFVSVFAVAFAIDMLAPRFDAERGYSGALRLAAYSFTPVWLAGIVLLVPGTSFLVLLGLYGIYLLWTGLPVLMRAPGKTLVPYLIAATACAIAIDVTARILLSTAIGAVH
jgi:Yip1 domain